MQAKNHNKVNPKAHKSVASLNGDNTGDMLVSSGQVSRNHWRW